MNQKTLKRLNDAGWNKNRQINIEDIEKELSERGFTLSVFNKEFLREYGNLVFELPNRNPQFQEAVCVHFNPIRTVGKNLYRRSLEYLEDEYNFIDADDIIPIGESENGNLLILCTKSNIFYGYTDSSLIKYGDTIDQMLDCLIGENREVIFMD